MHIDRNSNHGATRRRCEMTHRHLNEISWKQQPRRFLALALRRRWTIRVYIGRAIFRDAPDQYAWIMSPASLADAARTYSPHHRMAGPSSLTGNMSFEHSVPVVTPGA
jgi:hypothetical protein